MTALLGCVIAFVGCYWMGSRVLVQGVLAVLTVGYFYGIVRANIAGGYAHFIFDSAVLGLYSSQVISLWQAEQSRLTEIRRWLAILIGWPMMLCLLPFQTLLITLVGLRGSIFFLPAIILGALLKFRDILFLSRGLAVLNFVSCCFGIAEYFLGVPRFYPEGPTTALIYASGDVAGHQYLRIPGTFTHAHVYGGTVVMTAPLLFGAWVMKNQNKWWRLLLLLGLASATVGVLMSATRMNFVFMMALVILATVSGYIPKGGWIVWIFLFAGIGYMVSANERLQRFTSLTDTDYISGRIAGSLNRSLAEIVLEYPMGNGLGGGGTSIPYFLQRELKRPIVVENEYARIALEQGLVGLICWIMFLAWFLIRSRSNLQADFEAGRRLSWWACLMTWGSATIGLGLAVSVPSAFLISIIMGWLSVKPLRTSPALVRRFSAAGPVARSVIAR